MDAILINKKNERRKRHLFRLNLFISLAYALPVISINILKKINYLSAGGEIIFILSLAPFVMTLPILIIIKIKKNFHELFVRAIYYAGFIIWLLLFISAVLVLENQRHLSLFWAAFCFTFFFSQAGIRFSSIFTAAAVISYLGASYFGINALGQKGDVSIELIYSLNLLATGLFMAFMSMLFVGQKEELKDFQRLLREEKEKVERKTAELAEARDELWGEMQLAKKIQTVLLPSTPSVEGFNITAYMKPTDEVGGDYYDIISTEQAGWVAIGDVSGHGVQAGLIMMMVQSIIRSIIKENPLINPSDLVRIVNNGITYNILKMNDDKYMTLNILRFSPDGKAVHAGLHTDILLYRAARKEVDVVKTSGMWISLTDDFDRFNSDSRFIVDSGDVVLLYTDGIIEAMDPQGGLFEMKNLTDVLRHHGHREPREISEAILSAIKGYKIMDDMTFVILKRI